MLDLEEEKANQIKTKKELVDSRLDGLYVRVHINGAMSKRF
jgi:hypothetical protein